jgi:hypothetical protein
MGEEDGVRRLAELKAYLEKRTHELEQELLKLRSLEEMVDVALTGKSFRRAEVPDLERMSPPATIEQVTSIPIRTASGVELADMHVSGNEVKVVPKPDIKFDPDAPPLRAFLVGRVLEPMRSKDKTALQTGQITTDRVLSYRIEQDGILRQILIVNYGDERRFQELRSAISWTLRRMYEKMISTK